MGEIDNRPGALENVFNDGKCDPSGRFWGGKKEFPVNASFIIEDINFRVY